MPRNGTYAPDRIREFLNRFPELSQRDRELVRNVLQKATSIQLAQLLTDRDRHPTLEAIRNEHRQEQAGTGSDPVLVAFAILGAIAVLATIWVVLQW